MLYDTAIRVVETTLLTSTLLIEAMEFIPDIVIYGGIYSKNEYENDVSRDPSQGKSIPEWSYR